tara:strand:- start:1129 stop:1704 length:576 start_codon:yes stop_codon:yes gene_type:complete
MNFINIKPTIKEIDPELASILDEDFSQIHHYLNQKRKDYFYGFNIKKMTEALMSFKEAGLDESSIYFKKTEGILDFVEKALDDYESYDNKEEFNRLKNKINNEKLIFFNKAVMFDGKQRDVVMDKIDEKNKELSYDYEYIADNILTSLWQAGFEEKIEDKFLEAKIDELPYFHFSNYNKMPIENKVSHLFY